MRPLVLLWCAVSFAVPLEPQPTRSSQVALQRDPQSHPGPAILDVSGSGELIAFESAVRLSPLDSNSFGDVYVLDRSSGRVTLESVAADGGAANGSSARPRFNDDGRYLVFTSESSNLVGPSTGPTHPQVFRRDRQTGRTQLVSHAPDGRPGDGWSGSPSISDDGGVVAFESGAINLVRAADANSGGPDVYVWDAEQDAIERISVTSEGQQLPNGGSVTPRVSGTGRYVTFVSSAPLDATGPVVRGRPATSSAQLRRVFLRDLSHRTTRLVSRTADGTAFDGYAPDISRDGRHIAFASMSGHTGEPDRTGLSNVYMHDTGSGRLLLVSRTAKGKSADGRSSHPAVSADGRYVVFASEASNMTCVRCPDEADLNLVSDIFRFDAATGSITRISGAGPPSEPWWESSAGPAIDGSGRVIAFSSYHPVDQHDVEYDLDLFIEVLPVGSDAIRYFLRSLAIQ